MSWADKLAALPGIGFRFTPHHVPQSSLLEALAPLLDKWSTSLFKQGYAIQGHAPFAVDVVSDDGFRYAIDARRMFVEFQHRINFKSQSAGPPVAEFSSQYAPFSELLPQVADMLVDAYARVNPNSNRHLDRIGVVCSTQVAANDLPPGITRFLGYLGKPWGGELEAYHMSVTSTLSGNDELSEKDEYSDRCSHTVVMTENPDDLITVKFDWQRTYSKLPIVTPDTLSKLTRICCDAACEYFEALGEGNRFDERILNKAN